MYRHTYSFRESINLQTHNLAATHVGLAQGGHAGAAPGHTHTSHRHAYLTLFGGR